MLLGWGFFSLMGYIVLLFSLPSYASSIGLTSQQGSVVGAVLNLGQGLGRPLVGICSDSAGRINLAGLCTFICGFFCFVIWIFAKSYGVIIFFAIIVGTVAGTFWTTIAPVGAEVVGLKELPSALSIVWLALVLPTTCEFAAGLSRNSQLIQWQFQNPLLSSYDRRPAISTFMHKFTQALCTLEVRFVCGFFALGRLENWRLLQYVRRSLPKMSALSMWSRQSFAGQSQQGHIENRA